MTKRAGKRPFPSRFEQYLGLEAPRENAHGRGCEVLAILGMEPRVGKQGSLDRVLGNGEQPEGPEFCGSEGRGPRNKLQDLL